MHSWLEFSRQLPILILAALLLFVLAIFLYDGLRALLRGIRSWLAEKTPEEEVVDAIVHHQGAFHLHQPGAVRRRFAHRYEVAVRSHWGAGGHWKSYP